MMNYPQDYINKVICGDCLEVMKGIPDKTVDMILCDLPYGTTEIEWDVVIPWVPLWSHYERIIKDNGAIVLTASQPFTTDLIASNRKLFRYELIWEKTIASGFLNSKLMPLKSHENVLIFYKALPTYNPQMAQGDPYKTFRKANRSSHYRGDSRKVQEIGGTTTINEGNRYPRTVIKISSIGNTKHPTQKPLELFEYLIRTFSNPDDLVLDNCIGSGTTAKAAHNLKRNFIGIEISPEYCKISEDRLKQQVLNF